MSSKKNFDVNSLVRDVMAECGNNRDRAATLLIERDGDALANEAFRVLGIKQAIRSFSTDARSSSVRQQPTPTSRKAADSSPAVQKARKAVNDVVEAFMQMHTLFGGRVNLKEATRPDFKRSAESYAGQEAGAKKMRQFHTDCMGELPVGSIAAVLPVSKYPTIFKLAQQHGVVGA